MSLQAGNDKGTHLGKKQHKLVLGGDESPAICFCQGGEPRHRVLWTN